MVTLEKTSIIAALLLTSFYPAIVNCVTLHCNFNQPGFGTDIIHECQGNGTFNESRVTIDAVVWIKTSESNEEINGLALNSIKTVKFFPKNIDLHFKNLIAISITNSGLEEITSDDLMPFTKLKFLFLEINNIMALGENLFKYNPALEEIDLYRNDIHFIAPYIFDGLNNLTVLKLGGNKCKTQLVEEANRTQVESYKRQINANVCASVEFLLTKTKEQNENLTVDIKVKDETYQKLSNEMKEYITTLNANNSKLNVKVEDLNREKDTMNNNLSTTIKGLKDNNTLLVSQKEELSRIVLNKINDLDKDLQIALKKIEEHEFLLQHLNITYESSTHDNMTIKNENLVEILTIIEAKLKISYLIFAGIVVGLIVALVKSLVCKIIEKRKSKPAEPVESVRGNSTQSHLGVINYDS